MANTVFIGPNGNSESIITHAAIASWAGFVYQGLCALCVAMEKLLDEDEATTWYLNIEGYEDFAILDADKHILSFHQCKDYKAKKSWKDEFVKMEDKRFYWNQKGICKSDAPLYFHTNLKVDYANGVVGYVYKDGTSDLNTEEIFSMLYDLVDEYCTRENIPVSADRVRNRLVVLVEEQINFLDVQDKKVTNQTQKLSIDNSIPFRKIDELIRSTEEDRTLEEKVRLSVFYLNLYLIDRLDNNPNVDSQRVVSFLDRVNNMDKNEKMHIIKCLFPDINIEKGINSATEISNSPRVNFLFNLLIGVDEELDIDKLLWCNDGILQSPSSMGNDKSPEEYCGKIAMNQTLPPGLLRDFDWIVGCFDYTIDDILGNVVEIGRIHPVNYNDITKARKTGLLSINDKNNGRI